MTTDDIGHKHLIDWLRDAHAMERTAEKMIEKQLDRLSEHDHPEMVTRLSSHLDETRTQAQRIETCLDRLGSDTSTTKDLLGRFASLIGMLNAPASDEPIKHHIGSYTLEHQEIVCYRSLVAAARYLGEEEIAAACQTSLEEEERMADWLGERIGDHTVDFLRRELADRAA